jgi:hypothetical protein
MVRLELFELMNLLADATELGAKRALIGAGLETPFLSATKAYTLYGRKTVERWVRERLIVPQKDGQKNSGVRLDKMTLETLSKSSNRLGYFNPDSI